MHVSYINPNPVNYLEMAVGTGYQPGIGKIISNTKADGFSKSIDNLVKKGSIENSKITRNPDKTWKLLGDFAVFLDDLYKDKETYGSLKDSFAKYGRYLKIPSEVKVFDDNENAVARTEPQKGTIEANINFEYLVNKMAKQYGVKKEYVKSYARLHEISHIAQPENVLLAKPQPIIAEYDNELVLRAVSLDMARSAKTPEKREEYIAIAKIADTRAKGYEQVLKQYVSNSYRKAA